MFLNINAYFLKNRNLSSLRIGAKQINSTKLATIFKMLGSSMLPFIHAKLSRNENGNYDCILHVIFIGCYHLSFATDCPVVYFAFLFLFISHPLLSVFENKTKLARFVFILLLFGCPYSF